MLQSGMKILRKDLKHGMVAVLVQGTDDLWHLASIIEPLDTVSAETQRKVKVSESSSVKKSYYVTILVERVTYDQQAKQLRILGTTTSEHEDFPKGSYQTIEAEPGVALTITKTHWLSYQIARLEEAASNVFSDVLVCLLDRESAIIAILKSSGYEVLVELHGEVAKKYEGKMSSKAFYPEVAAKLKEYNERFTLSSIVIGSPAFWKEELIKELTDPVLAKKIRTTTVNSVDRNGLEEVLKRPELKTVLGEDRVAKEAMLVEELLKQISTDGLASYGWTDVSRMAHMGVVKTLLVTSALIALRRAEGRFEELDAVMKSVDSAKGSVHILNSDNEPGKRLDALSGIAALLRFRA